jgi:oligopeptide/dipeptide ABC transporter ATP-binding protein
MEIGSSDEFFTEPIHPYTLSLVSAAVQEGPEPTRERIILQGDPPSPTDPPSGCRFHTRCWLREVVSNPERCATERPPLAVVGGTHQVSCHFVPEAIAHPIRRRLVAEIAAGAVVASPTPAPPGVV